MLLFPTFKLILSVSSSCRELKKHHAPRVLEQQLNSVLESEPNAVIVVITFDTSVLRAPEVKVPRQMVDFCGRANLRPYFSVIIADKTHCKYTTVISKFFSTKLMSELIFEKRSGHSL